MTRYITDGFNEWFLCHQDDCQLRVVAPGKAQCQRCDSWNQVSNFYADWEAEQNDKF